MAIVGGIVSAIGSVAQGAAQAAQARYQAKVAENNAIIAEQNAEYQRIKGSREEEAFRIKATNLRASQKAAAAASGIDVGTGSPVHVQIGSRVLEELDALTIRNNAWREAADFEQQKMNFQASAEAKRMEAGNAMLSGVIGGVSGIAGSIGSVAPKWGSWRSTTPYQPVDYGPSLSPGMSVPVLVEEPPRNPGYMQPTRSPYAPIPGTLGI